MLTPKDADRYRLVIEEAVAALGRDDVGVKVEDGGEGMLAVTFSRGTRTHQAKVPMEALQEHEQAHITVNKALLALSKAVAQEAVTKATR